MNNSEPIRLESLSISNIRRFGEDVTIRMGSGATILLAPNGSGKTAVFEAIELALTSGVQRVEDRLPHLIRDGLQRASVRLNFGAWQREVAIVKDKVNLIEAGRLEDLFHDLDSKEIPFLLRLTHLLDQRDRSWFCQQNPDAAGGQLDMLPLGRLASQVSATVGRLKPAVTRAVSDIAELQASKEAALNDWTAVVAARDNAAGELSGPLVPLTEIADRLAIAWGHASPQINTIAGARERWSIASASVNQRVVDIQSELNSLSGLTALPAAHAEAIEFVRKATQDLQELIEARRQYEVELNANAERVVSTEPTRKQFEAALEIAKARLYRKQQHQRTSELIERLTTEWEHVKFSIEEHNTVFDVLSAAYQSAISNSEVHEALRGLMAGVAQRQLELKSANAEFEKWNSLALERVSIESRLKTSVSAVGALAHEAELAKLARELNESTFARAESSADSYRQAAGAIRGAVSTIAATLPPDVDDCPVCSVNHGHEELKRRIAAVISSIDPRLNEATRALQQAANELDSSKKKELEKREELKVALNARRELENEVAQIDDRIAVVRSNHLLVGFEFDGIPERFLSLSKEIETETASLDAKRVSVPATLDADAMTALAKRYAEARSERERLAELYARKLEALSDANRELSQIDLGSDAEIGIENLKNSMSESEQSLSLAVGQIQQALARKLELSRVLEQVDAQISRVSSQVSLSEVESATRISQWTVLGLQGVPSADVLVEAKASATTRLKDANDAKISLSEIELELNRHAGTRSLDNAQQAVDKVRGNLTEDEYSSLVQASLNDIKRRHEHAVGRKNALDAFAVFLTAGLGSIRGEVQNIVPQWQAILKRIVQDPRFSETSLSYLKKRNKNLAEVAVAVGALQAPVTDIASQAQMTDLQLSFLLSMATVHQWSPWKALLLDDPTQHHDLVHAASVFDVLRDFISEQGYQLVLTTHDPMQARFLMRKLTNDGIDARLWTLRPTEHGMVAQQIGGKQGA
jgi:exonuclease SbcC